MKLLEADINKFQGLYRKHFGEELDRQMAYSLLSSLVRQVQIIYQPITKRQLEEYQTANNEYENDNNDYPVA